MFATPKPLYVIWSCQLVLDWRDGKSVPRFDARFEIVEPLHDEAGRQVPSFVPQQDPCAHRRPWAFEPVVQVGDGHVTMLDAPLQALAERFHA